MRLGRLFSSHELSSSSRGWFSDEVYFLLQGSRFLAPPLENDPSLHSTLPNLALENTVIKDVKGIGSITTAAIMKTRIFARLVGCCPVTL